MFDLEATIRSWREEFSAHRSLSASDLDELEDHLRCTYDSLAAGGLAPEEAWTRAREGLGASTELSTEFRRVDGVAWRRLLLVGWAMFVMAFFLPVHRYGDTLFHVSANNGFLPGIQAFLVALHSGWVGVASALTNVVMVLTMGRVVDRGRARVAALASGASAAFLLNAAWLWSFHSSFVDLRIGYFVWWASFGVVAAGLTLRARALSPAAAPIISD